MPQQPTAPDGGDVTRLLHRWTDGDSQAADALLPIVYRELRLLAQRYMRRERADHTLAPTGLVHEAYMRLTGGDSSSSTIENRVHFFAAAAQAMRRVLVEHARRYAAARRISPRDRVSLDEGFDEHREERPWLEILAVHDALERLRAEHPRKARVVELRYFGGLTEDDIAEVLEVSRATISRDWRVARLLLSQLLGEERAGEG